MKNGRSGAIPAGLTVNDFDLFEINAGFSAMLLK